MQSPDLEIRKACEGSPEMARSELKSEVTGTPFSAEARNQHEVY